MTLLNVGNSFPNPKQVFLHVKIHSFLKKGVNVINFASNDSDITHINVLKKEWKGKLTLCSYNKWSLDNLIKIFFAIHLLTFKEAMSFIIAVYNINKNIVGTLAIIRNNLLLLYYSRRADIIQFDWINQATAFIPILDYLKKPIVVSIRGKAIAVQPLLEADLMEKYSILFKKASAIHCISHDLSKYLDDYLVDREKIVIIHPAIDLNSFSGDTLKKRNLNKSSIKIITVAHLTWKKNLLSAIIVMKRLIDKGYKITYHIIGEGPERAALTFAIKDFGITDKIILRGFLSHDLVVQELQNSDIFLIPSIQEGFCNAAIEAQAVGIPVVASNAEGLSENIEHNVTGIIFDKWEIGSMELALEKLINDEALRKSMQKAGIKRVKEKFSIENQIAQFQALFSRLITSHNNLHK